MGTNVVITWSEEKSNLKRVFVLVLLWVDFPPKFLAKAFGPTAYALEVVQIIGGYALKYLSHATHGEHGQTVVCTGVIEMPAKEFHELATLRGFGFLLGG